MQRRVFFRVFGFTSVLLATQNSMSFAKDEALRGPLLAPYAGPRGGVPAFDKIRPADFKPALLEAMDTYRTEIADITSEKRAPTFANTLVRLEDAGRAFTRASTLFGVYTSTMNDKQMQAVEKEMAPIFAAFSDEIIQNEALFSKIKTVHEAQARVKLTSEQRRLLEVVHRSFTRRGGALPKTEKTRLAAINQKLASLYTTFSQNQLADEESYSLVLDKAVDLAGLPNTQRTSLAESALASGRKGKWLIKNTRSSVEPFLTYSTRRDLREKAWRMWTTRGDNPGPKDNKPIITRILQLRAERAKLLGFPSHAHWIIDDNMARTPAAALSLMMKVWKPALARARQEIVDMQRVADAEKANHKIAPWDYRFYAEKVRKAKYDIDQNEIKSYLELDNMREAMFWAAERLYGLSFKAVNGIPVYHPDVRVYEVTRNGKRVGLWYFDPYSREGKRSGAWMSEYRTQESFKNAVTPIVSNNSNFVKGKPGEPVLISWDDAITLFHEFGHALHGLSSQVKYPTLAGTNTKSDFVEFPSQLNEHWLWTREILDKFALHCETKQPIPKQLLDKLEKAKTFNEGFRTVEYLLSAIYDLKIHSAPGDKPIDPGVFEKNLLQELGAPPQIALRHRPTQFGHVFSSDGYSAGYYSYLWADALTADAGEAFVEAGGYYDKATAKRFQSAILSVGNSIAPDEAFRRFRGRDVDTNALMRDRGFPITN